ncbi:MULTISPECIES: sensor histidine kinase [Thermomonospora]|uniref:histidine kinase n=1 Tax=Thermomonospora curvata (strain ATCC 19995 / DSM 43183 / JCM 3096 / KCTC 9072 / NBRC 15933 / NCIMB 10081 / Henssen B9) TaxID=471852 RepID=D1AE37_THECD|nr:MULTISPECIES: sensor domain-containing protein [Thermomonospora]ACY99463.1 histidine kinase [Thermomonospora curvata DSM 43183]PKK12504.1 MAG: sensor histidine kinase [Thermomonospora sp. CIF 1]
MSELNVMAVPGGSGRIVTASWKPLAMVRSSLNWRAALYLGSALAFGLAWFIVLAVGLTLSAALVIIWVGLPMLVIMMLLWRGGAMLERRLLKVALGVAVPEPYRPAPPSAGVLGRLRTMATDPATWKDLLYLALRFPIGLVEFVVSAAVWSATAAFVFLPLIVAVAGEAVVNLGVVVYTADDPISALPVSVVGVGLLLVALYVTRGMAVLHALYGMLLLGPSRGQAERLRLQARAEQLRASRARGVDAAEAERRRIERDLHDGAQQRLLAVAMDIGRARAKLTSDPEAARALIEQAHEGTKAAIAELRDLARGIYPAILTDRGLDAAISGLAARAPVPVLVEVELPERPPAAVESIAYFIVAESLTNIAKYARATQASVRVTREGRWVVVEVTDNGVGGATAVPGGGLAGLADRAATIDGILTIDSPVGGPTVIRADLPCSW